MYIYVLPGVLALLTKLLLLVTVRRRSQQSDNFLVITILIFILSDLLLVLSSSGLFEVALSELLLRFYYVSTLFVVAYAFLHSVSTMQLMLGNYLALLVLITAGCLTVPIMLTDTIIAGSMTLGYSATGVAGDLYWLYTFYMAFCFLALPLLFAYSFMQSISDDHRKLMARHMVALSPVYLCAILVGFLTFFGLSINASVLIPVLSTGYLLYIITKADDQPKEDYKIFLNGSPERHFANGIIEVGARFANGECSLSQANNDIEALLMQYERNTNSSLEHLE